MSNIVKDLLMTLAKGETHLESQRQALCAKPDFSPQSAFEAIAGRNRVINKQDIIDFLGENGKNVTSNDAVNLITYFDQKGDRTLDTEEICNMMLSC